MALFKISKGLKANLPSTKTEGYCWYTTDDSLFYIDYKDSNGVLQRKALNAKDAETLTGASLSTILNSSDVEIPTSKAVLDALGEKVDKISGKGLSTNDYTTDDKNNVAANTTARHTHSNKDILDQITGIVTADNVTNPTNTTDLVDYSGFQAGSQAIISLIPTVDTALSSTSTNPVQNKVINTKLSSMQSDIDSKVEASDAITGLSVSGKTVTYTKGDGSTGTITTQDTQVNREPITTDADYPILLSRSSINSTVDTTAVINSNIKANPSEGSIYVNRLEVYGTAKADGAYAGGYGSFANNIYSFAHGQNASASNTAAFSHGNSTTASGAYSHAEGDDTIASGTASHAEGYNTTASRHYAHAEGYQTTAGGSRSHAEGTGTTTSGEGAHAEGYYTIAKGNYSHAQGKYNVADSGNDYAHIVGNGTSDEARSNAHTLDWDGNAWFAGDVYTGSTSGTDKDSGSKKLATEEYVDSNKADISAGVYTVTASSSDGVSYTATVPGITELKNGISFIMIPSIASTSTAPTINVNELGAKPIKRRLSNISTSLQFGYSSGWLAANLPFRLIYDATTKGSASDTGVWVVEGLNKPSGADVSGPVPQAKADASGNIITDTYATIAMLQSMLPKVTTITLSGVWGGSSSPYYKDVDLSCATETSLVTLQPTPEQLASWQNAGLAFTTLSGNGTVRVYCAGGVPSEDISIQVTVQEVVEV